VGSTTSGDGLIAFVSDRDDNREIYVMNADGSEQIRLTDHRANDGWPTISPDGTMVAFISDRSGNYDLYSIHTDGSGLTQLTTTFGQEMYPAWSPDGTRIAFMRNYDIFVMNADGSNEVNLTKDEASNLYPVWPSGGSQIVFLSLRDGGFQFYEMNTDGSGLTMLDSGLPPSEGSPGSFGIYLFEDGEIWIGSSGSMETIQDRDSALGEFPAWSPDGTQIAFHSRRAGNLEIYVMNTVNAMVSRLTNNDAKDMFPAWSPDGNQIIFHSDRDGNMEIYMMNADGSNVQNLTNHPAEDTFPAWHP
jgi:TolB protein